MIIAATSREFIRRWRKREGLTQKKLAALLGYTQSFVEKIECGQKLCGLRFSFRFMGLLNDQEKLQFLDLTMEWYEEVNPKYNPRRNQIDAIKELRKRKRLSQITADDLALLKAQGVEIDGETKDLFKEKPVEKRKNRGKKRHP